MVAMVSHIPAKSRIPVNHVICCLSSRWSWAYTPWDARIEKDNSKKRFLGHTGWYTGFHPRQCQSQKGTFTVFFSSAWAGSWTTLLPILLWSCLLIPKQKTVRTKSWAIVIGILHLRLYEGILPAVHFVCRRVLNLTNPYTCPSTHSILSTHIFLFWTPLYWYVYPTPFPSAIFF